MEQDDKDAVGNLTPEEAQEIKRILGGSPGNTPVKEVCPPPAAEPGTLVVVKREKLAVRPARKKSKLPKGKAKLINRKEKGKKNRNS